MNTLYFAFSTVFPLCFTLILGYLARMLGWLSEDASNQMNKVCFNIFLPTSLFMSVYKSQLKVVDYELIGFGLVIVCLFFLLVFAWVHHTSYAPKTKGVMIQGMARSNFILFGIPLTASFLGSDQVGTTAVLIAFVIPLYNVLSIFALQLYQDGGSFKLLSVLKKSLTNPLIIGTILAFICVLLSIKLPSFLVSSLDSVSSAATPLALFLLGSNFVFSKLGSNSKLLIQVVCSKLILMPAIVLGLAYLLEFKGAALVALLAMSASPTAVSSYTMAQSMHMDDEAAGQIVVITTILSIFTIFVWIMIMKTYML